MSELDMSPASILLQVVIQELPSIIEGIKTLFKKDHSDDPVPSDSEVIRAFNEAYSASIAKDEMWLAAHPETPSPPSGDKS